jgi:hypothetical protein
MFLCVKKKEKTLKGLRNDVIIQPYYSKNKTKMALEFCLRISYIEGQNTKI